MKSIETIALTKHFQPQKRLFHRQTDAPVVAAVSDLTFSLEQGEFVGFLGPNGAGKSTTIKMLTGILHPSSGEVHVAGLSPQRDRVRLAKRIGVVFGQRTQLWWDLPLRESFRILRRMYGVSEVDHQMRLDLLNRELHLDEFMATPVRQLSLGQRMRGELAAALLHHPEILFLDEPTIGLDVTAKAAIRAFLRDYNRQTGATIILTTHDMGDVEELCQRILMIAGGTVRFDGAIQELHRRVGIPSAIEVTFNSAPQGIHEGPLNGNTVGSPETVQRVQVRVVDKPNTLRFEFNRQVLSPVGVLELAAKCGNILDFSMQEPRLEDVMERIYQRG